MKEDQRYIRNLPPIICQDKSIKLDYEFIKRKLLNASRNGQKWSDSNFLLVARGEGRKEYVDYITSNEVFKWGIKSMHSTIRDELAQELLGSNNHSINFLYEILIQIHNSFMYYVNIKDEKGYKISINEENVNNIIQDLRVRIESVDNDDKIRELKYELCLYLHLLNYHKDTVYRYNKFYLSGQCGYFRYGKAFNFAKGKNNSEYVVLDYWVRKKEESYTYMMSTIFYDILKKYGIKWFNDGKKNLNFEVMSKYVLLPHRLVGYTYYKDGIPQFYCINNYLAKEWETNPDFEIGEDDLYIDQNLETIGGEFPYNIIYTIDQNLNYDFIRLLDKNSK